MMVLRTVLFDLTTGAVSQHSVGNAVPRIDGKVAGILTDELPLPAEDQIVDLASLVRVKDDLYIVSKFVEQKSDTTKLTSIENPDG